MKKFLIFVSLFCLVFSIMAVSAFAYIDPGEYAFREVLLGTFDGTFYMDFVSNNRSFTAIEIYSGFLDNDVSKVSYYDGTWLTVYQDGEWLDFEYRFLDIYSIANTDNSYEHLHRFLEENADLDPPVHGSSLFYVLTYIIQWIASSLTFVLSLFFVDGSLTLFGILSLVVGGIGLVFVLINVITNFLGSRG